MRPDKHYPQIDTLRIIAALGVINFHWLSQHYLSLYGIDKSFDWGFGMFGVQLFFVLSGFLISDILINNKEQNPNRGKTIFNFFVRRALRLFPVYFLFIAYLIIIKDQFVIENVVWFLTYTANVKFFLEGGLVDIWSNHLWTLSIEEQLYLLFPSILFFIPRKIEYVIPLIFIAIGIFTKEFSANKEVVFLLAPAQTDMLGIGILVALIKNKHNELYLRLSSSKLDIPVFLLLSANILLYYFFREDQIAAALLPYLLMVTLGLIVLKTSSGYQGMAGKILENSYLRYLGKISYGLYVYHKVVPLSLVLIFNKIDIQIESVLLYYLMNLAILFLISHFSWRVIESPFLKLKSRFEYSKG